MTSDLHLLALQYALGELAGADCLAFERRLEFEQAAREALADAVLLTSAVRQLPALSPAPASVVPPAKRTRIAAVASCAAASLLLLLVIRLPGTVSTVVQRDAADAQAAEDSALVGAWMDLGSDHVLLSELDSEALRDDSSEIPDWMVAAVLEEADAAPRKEGTL